MNLPLPPKFTLHHLASPPAHASPGSVTAQRSNRNDSPSFNSVEQQNQKRKEKEKAKPAVGVENTSCVSAQATDLVKSTGDMLCDLETPHSGLGWVQEPSLPQQATANGC